MVIRLLLTLFLFFGYGPILMAGSSHIIIEKLVSMAGNVQVFSYARKLPFLISDLPEGFNNAGYALVKTGDGLFALPQGTGRVYQYSIVSKSWQRIDSTFFTGYNYGSIQFSLRDQIYSFGGYGLWHINGVLRLYNSSSKEWNPVKTNRYIPWKLRHDGISNFYFLDTISDHLIVHGLGETGFQSLKDISESEIGTDMYSLDILNGEWQKLGQFRDTAYSMIGLLPWGILDLHGTVIDIRKNTYRQLSGKLLSKLHAISYKSLKGNDNLISFCYDSTLYLSRDANHIDSLTISEHDLIDLEIPVYQSIERGFIDYLSGYESYLSIVLALIGGFLGGNYLKTKRYKVEKSLVRATLEQPSTLTPILPDQPIHAVAEKPEPPPPAEKTVSFRSSKLLDLLEEKERSLLEFIYRYSAEERLTTIEEINKVIGVGSRSAEIQKRMRSDLIGSINQKMGLITKDKKPLIEKQRSEFDKRSFEYFIRTEHMDLVERVLGLK